MSEIKNLYRDILSCWYELSWDAHSCGIVLRIHEDFLASQEPIPTDAPIIQMYQKNLGMEQFFTDFDEDIGFDRVFIRLGEKDGFVEFFIKIPWIRLNTNIDCEYCDGTGKGEFRDRCGRCNNGKKYKYDRLTANKIGASLAIITTFLRTQQVQTSAEIPQLFVVSTSLTYGMQGAPINGEVGIPCVEYLNAFAGEDIPLVREAVMQAYNHMWPIRKHDKPSFKARVYDGSGRFMIDCPGDACGIGCGFDGSFSRSEIMGYGFSCHNPDSVLQQLSLVAGLAALHDIVRNQISF